MGSVVLATVGSGMKCSVSDDPGCGRVACIRACVRAFLRRLPLAPRGPSCGVAHQATYDERLKSLCTVLWVTNNVLVLY